MSKLLHHLRSQLAETTATTNFSYSPGRRRRKNAVDKLVIKATGEASLSEAAALWVRSRTKIESAGLTEHPTYERALHRLDTLMDGMTEQLAYRIHECLTPLFEAAETVLMGDEFASLHKKFINAFSKEFDVEVQHWEAVAEGVCIYTDTVDTVALARRTEDVRKFANQKGYLIVKKGTTDQTSITDHACWIFIFDQHYTKEKK